MKTPWALLLVSVFLGFGACSDDDSAGNDNQADAAVDADTADADTTDAGPDGGSNNNNAVQWVPCALDVNDPYGEFAECTMVEAPLRHAEPDGPRIDLWVQRVAATATPKKGQIWFLQGGPGGSGADLAGMLKAVREVAPEWDLLTTDHRGVGNSTRLGCPLQEAAGSDSGFGITIDEVPACLQHVQDTWGDDLAEFTLTAAAADMGLLVDRIREPDQDVFLYGVSYGTTWLIRYLHLHPDQVNGVILDSLAPPGLTFEDYDEYMDDIGEDLLGYCATDTLCASHLGNDPWTTAGQIFDDLEQGSCPGFSALLDSGTERETLRNILGWLLRIEGYRELIPAVLHRLNRCDPADVLAVENLLTTILSWEEYISPNEELGSAVLGFNIGLAELWSDPLPDASALQAVQDTLLFSLGVSTRFAALQDLWPFYPDDQYEGTFPTTDLPILLGNGTLDPQTPHWVAQPAQAHFTGAYQYYYELPRCAHGLISQSPVTTQGAPHCFLQMILEFVDDPLSAPSSACASDIEPLDFSGAHPHSMYWLGENDMWENGAPPPPPSIEGPAVHPPAARRSLRWLRQRLPTPHFLRQRAR